MTRWLKQTFELSHGDHRAILPMEGVRGFAVFLVFLVHYVTLVMPWLDPTTMTHGIAVAVETMGHLGVDLFFVLSGYLIYGMLIAKPRPMGRYAVRRVQRIYPTFAAVFVLYLLLSAVFPGESKIPSGVAGAWYVLQNALLLPGIFEIEPMITVAWSLSYEALAYITIPLMVRALSMRTMKRWQRVACLLVLSAAVFVLTAAWLGHLRLTMFLCGMLVFETIDAGGLRWLKAWSLPALCLALSVTIAVPWLGLPMWGLFVLLFFLFFVFCAGCLIAGGTSTRLFLLAPLRWLGNMSYSYYLIHGLTLKALFLVFARLTPAQAEASALFWILLPIAFVTTLVPSAVLFIGVEKPCSLVCRPGRKPSPTPVQGGLVAGPQA
ncbi:MAG: acyltransferase [Phycisphaeraceae bacterium]|nr:acyltransferase [Phycisphaeraceae bacterium]